MPVRIRFCQEAGAWSACSSDIFYCTYVGRASKETVFTILCNRHSKGIATLKLHTKEEWEALQVLEQ